MLQSTLGSNMSTVWSVNNMEHTKIKKIVYCDIWMKQKQTKVCHYKMTRKLHCTSQINAITSTTTWYHDFVMNRFSINITKEEKLECKATPGATNAWVGQNWGLLFQHLWTMFHIKMTNKDWWPSEMIKRRLFVLGAKNKCGGTSYIVHMAAVFRL